MSEETKVTTTETEVVEDKATENAAAKEETTQVEKTFTQKEVDDLIQKRIARETKKFEKKLAETAKPSENQINLEDENATLKNQIASLNKQILTYEAGKIASTLNVRNDRLDAFLRLADLSDVELDDKGTYKDEIKEKIEALVADFPEFVKTEDKKVGAITKIGGPEANEKSKREAEDAYIRSIFGLKPKN